MYTVLRVWFSCYMYKGMSKWKFPLSLEIIDPKADLNSVQNELELRQLTYKNIKVRNENKKKQPRKEFVRKIYLEKAVL